MNDLQEGAKKHGKRIRVIIEREIKVYVGHKTPLVEGENCSSPSLPQVSGTYIGSHHGYTYVRLISFINKYFLMVLNTSWFFIHRV